MNQVLLAMPTNGESHFLLFWISYSGNLISQTELESVSLRVSDAVDQKLWVNPTENHWSSLNFSQLQIIHFKAGVTDNPAHSFQELLGFESLFKERSIVVHSGEAILLKPGQTFRPVNGLIQAELRFAHPGPQGHELNQKIFAEPAIQSLQVEKISLHGLSESELVNLSNQRFWALNAEEMRVIQKHFGDQAITDVEIEVLAQTWSEHCKHKIFGATIQYQDEKETFKVESLFKTYIQAPTTEIQKKKNWAISVFKDNAGIVRFHDQVDLCIKVETHNSPSALDPYGGALTGILGVNRDILGTGLGARPIANTNVLLFGDPNESEPLPQGLFHPREVLTGVHRGIQDGGNKSGIPTVNGAMLFDESFAGKPLVFCGTVGVLPQLINGIASASKNQRPGDLIVMVGGAVGFDGIHGATSSSLALDSKTPSSMVQIGDPLTQKRVMDFMLEARDLGLYNSVTDNGAGGLSSSIGEMASETNGAKVFLERVPLKYPGLQPWQIFVSESQERMTLSVPSENWEALQKLSIARNVESTVVGEFTASGYLEIFYANEEVGRLSLAFLHDGLPKMNLKAKWHGPRARSSWKKDPPARAPLPDAKAILERLLRDPSLASKEKWIRQYDHEVQGATVVKPFESGVNSAPNDGGVIWMGAHGNPGNSGAVISSGICPDFSLFDPDTMAKIAVDEAVRNALVTGADPAHLALIDNFCWPDPLPGPKNSDAEQKLAELVRTCRGLSEICRAYEMPLISGKDSMKNDFIGMRPDGVEVKISVLPTLLVTALAYHPDVNLALKPHAKAGSKLYLLDPAKVKTDSTSASNRYFGATLPKYFELESRTDFAFDLKKTRLFYDRFHAATRREIFASAHDLSEGGLLFAIFESLLLNQAGISLAMHEDELSYLFGEMPGRILVSVSLAKQAAFEAEFSNELTELGSVDGTAAIRLMKPGGTQEMLLKPLSEIWRSQV